jgi:hypothetical protein
MITGVPWPKAPVTDVEILADSSSVLAASVFVDKLLTVHQIK